MGEAFTADEKNRGDGEAALETPQPLQPDFGDLLQPETKSQDKIPAAPGEQSQAERTVPPKDSADKKEPGKEPSGKVLDGGQLLISDVFKENEKSGSFKFSPSEAEKDGFKRPPLESGSGKALMKDMQEFSSWLNTNFDILDGNGDGSLSEREVENAMADPSKANGEKAPFIDALYENYQTMKDELDAGNEKGISRESAKTLSELAQIEEFFDKASRALQVSDLNKIFPHLDANKDYRLSPDETQSALKLEGLSSEQIQALKDLSGYQRHLLEKDYPFAQKDSDGGELIMRDEGGGVAMTPRKHMGDLNSPQIYGYVSSMEWLSGSLSQSMEQARKRVESARDNPDQITQGIDGSCFFLVPLKGQSSNNADFMKDLIEDKGNNNFLVEFPGAPGRMFNVTGPTDAELSSWAIGKNAAILEKAFAQYYVSDLLPKYGNPVPRSKLDSPILSSRILGGRTSDAIKLLTGKEAVVKNLDELSPEQLEGLMKELAEKRTPIAADTAGMKLFDGLVPNHCYLATYDPASKEVVLENPVKPSGDKKNSASYPYEPYKADRAAQDGKDDGVFRMNLTDFRKYFWHINYPAP